MALLKGFWKLLVGIKDFLVLLLMVLIFAGIVTAMNQEEELPQVAGGGALTVPLTGFLVTQRQDIDPVALFTGAEIAPEIETRELVRMLERAAGDDRIDSVVLDMDGFLGGGLANVQAVADAVVEFRESGKPVYAFASAYLDAGWLIAAHADEVSLAPLGTVLVQGPGGSQLYFGEALEKLNVNVNVFRVGTYKSAVEPYTLTEASEPARRARQALADDLWANYLQDAEAARPQANLSAYVENLPGQVRNAGGDFARAALEAGLVDRLETRATFEQLMAERVGDADDMPGGYLATDFWAYLETVSEPGGDAVGIIDVTGTIVDGEAPAGTAGGETIANLVELAVADSDIKALVVNIDSPGGSVTASETIRQALLQARAEGLPVIARFGPVAASGGYWVATAADTVVAAPTSITGSIGVFMVLPTFEDTLAEIGVNADGVGTTPLSGAPDLADGLSAPIEELLQLSVEDIYRRFVGIVAEARGLDPERVDEIAQGRVWSGGAARQLGLVDRFGSLEDAVAAAEEAAGYSVGELAVVEVREPKPFFVQLAEDFLEMDAKARVSATIPHSAIDTRLAQQRAVLERAAIDAAAVAAGPAMQARCLSCDMAGRPVQPRERTGMLEVVKALLD
ncbi:signal peptide peptidase SppA [Pacificimonas flava]|uniref:Signal peptide peptidase SppA n=2 Tax=Pacificimonas TaxID=1960290 RepID=A0A219B239_9SPHN|nr:MULTISPECIES: signal peptide peptidase SppA [Pacificimonas]MBZ6377936.1 signal peptide peptidase SppA [Pacificimonas aurantium]OWV32407.1 signal peptide peptidase SppA [Pacificimonas flava]